MRRALLGMMAVVVATASGLAIAGASTSTASALPDPLFAPDFPDPSVLTVGGTTYAYGTNGRFGNVQVIRSSDLVTWERRPDALPELPAWAAPSFTWAPSVLPRANGYVLYYAARHRTTGMHCIGRAVGTAPDGPFVDDLPQPFVCQMDLRRSIDPQPFVDTDGQATLLFKSEGRVGDFSFGDAAYFGSTGALVLNSPIVSIVSKPWSDGYWLVAADGGVFAFGSAEYLGSAGDLRLNSPIVGAAAAPAGDGYWFVAADGGVFNFGRSGFLGSAGGGPLNRPIVGMAA